MARGSAWENEHLGVSDTSDEDPRDDDEVTYEHEHVYEESHLLVRPHMAESDSDERVAVYVGMEPEKATPTITDGVDSAGIDGIDDCVAVIDARGLQDALNEYLGEDDSHESAAFPKDTGSATFDETLTVSVDADVESARDAIESLQTQVDALTADLNDAADRVAEMDVGDTDYGLPAPSPSDVQAELSDTENDGKMVPAGPLYELAEMWASISAHKALGSEHAEGYRQARKESGEWLEDELDDLTNE